MDLGGNKQPCSFNPRKDATIFSILFFNWVNPLLYKGYKKDLEQQDLYTPLYEDRSDVLGDKLQYSWNQELEKCKLDTTKIQNESNSKLSKPSFIGAIIRTFGFSLIPLGIICFVEECVIRLLQPWFMGQLMRYFTYGTNNVSTLMACVYAFGVVFMTGCYCLIHHQYVFGVRMFGMRLRVAASSLIYRKTLKLTTASASKHTTGTIVNLMSNDVNRFDLCVIHLHYLWVAPLQFAIVIYLTWDLLEEVTLAGAAIMLFFIPMQGWLSNQFYRLRGETAKRTDVRINLMNEIINGIKVIKMYVWETSFANLIAKERRDEINVIKKTFYLRAFDSASSMIFVRLALALILILWVLNQNIVTPELAFLTLAWYNVSVLCLVYFLPSACTLGSEALKSISRIENFLLLEEFTVMEHEKKDLGVANAVIYNESGLLELSTRSNITVRNACAKWNPMADLHTIKDITFQISKGECYGICGSVGDGKSSVLQALLGELPLQSGDIYI